jgi:hypothetical protein
MTYSILSNFDAPTINNLHFNNSNDITSLRLGDKMLLKCFLKYVGFQHNEGNPIGNEWDQITQTEFDSFCIDPKYIKPSSTSTPASSNTRKLAHNSLIPLKCSDVGSNKTLRCSPFSNVKSIMISGIDHSKRKLQLKRSQKSWMIATFLLLVLFQEK